MLVYNTLSTLYNDAVFTPLHGSLVVKTLEDECYVGIMNQIRMSSNVQMVEQHAKHCIFIWNNLLFVDYIMLT